MSSRIHAITSPRLKPRLDILICPSVFFYSPTGTNFLLLLSFLPLSNPSFPLPKFHFFPPLLIFFPLFLTLSLLFQKPIHLKTYSPIDSLALQFLFIPRRNSGNRSIYLETSGAADSVSGFTTIGFLCAVPLFPEQTGLK